jgi:hypothetical protein
MPIYDKPNIPFGCHKFHQNQPYLRRVVRG